MISPYASNGHKQNKPSLTVSILAKSVPLNKGSEVKNRFCAKIGPIRRFGAKAKAMMSKKICAIRVFGRAKCADKCLQKSSVLRLKTPPHAEGYAAI